jgi:hypothetical protein
LHNEGHQHELASHHVDVVERFDHLTIEEMIDTIESSMPVENENLPPHVKNIDWGLLKQQKLTLLETITYLENNHLPQKFTDDLTGILNMIDSLQDDAVDIYGLEEDTVFNLSHEDDGE